MKDIERQKYLQVVTKKLVLLTIGSIIGLGIIFYCILPLMGLTQTYLVAYVFLCGLIGGFVSIQQRLPQIDLDELVELSRSWFSILLIPVNGGIFALVLMLLFLSGIIEGTLFPRYEHYPIDHENIVSSFKTWLTETFPEDGSDVSKLLFWSFVAGFSERFVPQIIRKVSKSESS